MAGIKKRGETWHLRMRVPKRYRSLSLPTEIHRSLRTGSEREARVRLPTAEAAVLAELDSLLAIGGHPHPDTAGNGAFAAAIAFATSRGMTYRPVDEIAQGSLARILEGIEALRPNDPPEAAVALLGGAEAPSLRLSQLVDEVERIRTHDNRFKSPEQIRLWRNPRLRATKNLQAAIGEDIEVAKIDNGTALRHRSWWRKKMAQSGQSADTANKDFSNMAGMLSAYFEDILMIDAPRPYAGITIRDRHAVKGRKLEMPHSWIVEHWLQPGALARLNDEARDILLMSIETGGRQSEIVDLPPGAIVLDAEIPHILISNTEGEHRREIKNVISTREMPLVGLALAAARRNPDGFPRYRGKSSYSAAVNKYLRQNGLLPSPKHTIGGLRHAWEQRLKAIGIETDDRGEMMGHSVGAARKREVYGDAMVLARKFELSQRIMLPVPDHLR
ncbi:DUF6538 domain-containing protein [Roseobacter sp. GAI101]|uniref:DUF6538 domain-containing protein n=1 Tax=Roseobacter sp. (strain GAI101) TaxID=391589 RepID=UPI000187184C|nr:DUF6538 domain-containing protein [Roseobacter sp. GAI101]EEB86509.1 phage integrase [Roseobacter sp. GAI101]